MPKQVISFVVNDRKCSVETHPMRRLLDVLREDLGLTGTKEGCGEGECGACSVIMNDELVNSCLIPVAQAHEARICTIEEVGQNGLLHSVQQAFIENGAAQCGICTPGMILASLQLLALHPEPTEDQIREGLSGNLCRCTGYTRIFEAVRKAAGYER
jgi:aerobic carbon-monoxide dehydrogenase small subunit